MSLLSRLGLRGKRAHGELLDPTLDPTLDTALDTGIARFEQGDLEGAQAEFDAVLAKAPTHPRALHLAGVASLARGQAPAAEALIRRAIAQDPAPYLYWFNLGNALAAQSRVEEAANAFSTAVERKPDDYAAIINLARACLDCTRYDRALEAARQAHALLPDEAAPDVVAGTALYRRAGAGQLVDDYHAAIAYLEHALSRRDISVTDQHNARLYMGDSLVKVGALARALPLFEALQAAAPDDIDANVFLANCLNQLGRIRDAAPVYARVVRFNPGHLPAISSAISAADYDHATSADDNTLKRKSMMLAFRDPQRHTHWTNAPDPDRRIRLGYVSPDFREHVAMTLFEDVLRRHDRNAFEIYAYDASTARDAKNFALRALVDHWREIDTLDTAATTALIRADGIDLLVDLAGHTAGNRLMVFARKPAPVAATWLAYPGSTGLPEIDYLVSDDVTSPVEFAAHASEVVWRLPATRLCFTPPAASPAPRLPAADAPMTFGCFNNVSKINASVLALWKQILDRLPGARLLFKYGSLDDATGRAWLARDLEAAGIGLERVEMRGKSDYVEMLGQYGDMHVALDPFPYCGGLSSLDALWMGVPVVTLEQTLMAGRQSAAFLHNVGATELIAATPNDYVRIAVELAGDRRRMVQYRETLRPAMRASRLQDYAGFTRNLEAAWRAMWRAWCDARR